MYCAMAGWTRIAIPPKVRTNDRAESLWIIRRVTVMIQMSRDHVEIRHIYQAVAVEVEPIADRARNSDAARDGGKVGRRDSLALVDVDPQPLHRVVILDAQCVGAVRRRRGQPSGEFEAHYQDRKVGIVVAPLPARVARAEAGTSRSRAGERDVGHAGGIGWRVRG